MERKVMAQEQDGLRSDYAHLLTLWTSGVPGLPP